MLSKAEQQHARLEDILDGPWARSVKKGLSQYSLLVLREALKSRSISECHLGARECRSSLRLILEQTELLGLAVRTGYLILDAAKAHVHEVVHPLFQDPNAEAFLFFWDQWLTVDILHRLNWYDLRKPYGLPPVISRLQVSFACLLTTHRRIRSDDLMSTAYTMLRWGRLERCDLPFQLQGLSGVENTLSLQQVIHSLSAQESSDGSPSLAVYLLEGFFGVFENLAMLFMPMDAEARAFVGQFYLRPLQRFGDVFLKSAVGAHQQSFASFESVFTSHSPLFARVGVDNQSNIREYFEVLADTLANVRKVLLSSTGGGGGGPNHLPEDNSVDSYSVR